jgi:hypothetical protein
MEIRLAAAFFRQWLASISHFHAAGSLLLAQGNRSRRDLPSHTYNAWLAHRIERGQTPGLYIESRWSNIIVDETLVGQPDEFSSS